MWLEFVMFWMRETLSNIRRNRVMSIMAISTATIGLLILGAFFLTLANLREIIGDQTQKLDLVVFIKPGVSAARRKQIYNAVHIQQVKDLRFASRSQVLREFQREHPAIPMDDFQGANNPFPEELRVKLKNPEDIMAVRHYFNSIKDVVETRDDADIVHDLLTIKRVVTVVGTIALGVLGLAILLIIHNAIRLTIFARRREIRIMELVGATPGFIRTPFLLEGVIYGILGSVIAAVILSILYASVMRIEVPLAQQLLPLRDTFVLWQCMTLIIGAGLVFGLVGSWISLARSIGRATHV